MSVKFVDDENFLNIHNLKNIFVTVMGNVIIELGRLRFLKLFNT